MDLGTHGDAGAVLGFHLGGVALPEFFVGQSGDAEGLVAQFLVDQVLATRAEDPLRLLPGLGVGAWRRLDFALTRTQLCRIHLVKKVGVRDTFRMRQLYLVVGLNDRLFGVVVSGHYGLVLSGSGNTGGFWGLPQGGVRVGVLVTGDR